jgi:hypothetical protein
MGCVKIDEEILGISWGKATARLNNLILFKLVQETGRDNCHRCGEKIVSSVDLSRDHIIDWRSHGPDKYWDLSNIAFSHKRCNILAGQQRRKKKPKPEKKIKTFDNPMDLAESKLKISTIMKTKQIQRGPDGRILTHS